jgi:hypothetical protein
VTTVDDAVSALSEDYPQLNRDDFEKILRLTSAGPSEGSGLSVAVALDPVVPAFAAGLKSLNPADISQHLRVLKAAASHVVTEWKDPASPAPEFGEVQRFLSEVDV